MSLFPSANDFKSGPGVEKDAPRKTGVGRFFELVGRDMSGMFLANLLTCLGFLPVICLVYIGFLIINIPGFCGFCKPQSPLNVKKVFPLPFWGGV